VLALYFSAAGDAAPFGRESLISAEGRALLPLLEGVSIESRTTAGLTELAEAADPSLRAGLAEIANWLPRIASLSVDERRRELEVASLNLRRQQLNGRHREVLSLLREPDGEVDRPTAASWLAAIAAQLREIEAALEARHGLGSIVWRSRQVGEVLGG
jgi:hypothetical protein